MKTLYIVRHAKSSWAFDLNDHDRPLGKRGRKDVIKMGKYLAKNYTPPEVLISSTASRAFYTALFICDQWGIDEGHIRLDKNLFHAGSSNILEVVKKAPQCETLAIFGHNPGFTDFVNRLARTSIYNVPTCGVVGVSVDIDSWKDITFGSGEQVFFQIPKEIKVSS